MFGFFSFSIPNALELIKRQIPRESWSLAIRFIVFIGLDFIELIYDLINAKRIVKLYQPLELLSSRQNVV